MSLSRPLATEFCVLAQSREQRFRRCPTEVPGTPFRGAKPVVTGLSIPATGFTGAFNLIKTPGSATGVCGMLREPIWQQEKSKSRLLRSLGHGKVGARGRCAAGGSERADHSTTRADRDTTPGERDGFPATQIVWPELRPRCQYRAPD